LAAKELAHEADFEEQWGPKKVPKQSYRFVDNKGHSGFGFGNKPTECLPMTSFRRSGKPGLAQGAKSCEKIAGPRLCRWAA